jgi:hypothetical protein
MSLAKLRQIRRLKARAAPVIAERDRRIKERTESLPSVAEEHLLRVILVFRYGEPQIDEPLSLAYCRALSKMNDPSKIVTPLSVIKGKGNSSSYPIDSMALNDFRTILEREPPDEDIQQKISTWVKQMPDWLRHLCDTGVSMKVLKLESPPPGQDKRKFYRTKSDRRAWPMLPQGMLKPHTYYDEDDRFIKQMSPEEAMAFIRIYEKPEEEWTRRERRFIDEMFAREPKD